MINFDAVDFSERRSEEVISFFWRSVYLHKESENLARLNFLQQLISKFYVHLPILIRWKVQDEKVPTVIEESSLYNEFYTGT